MVNYSNVTKWAIIIGDFIVASLVLLGLMLFTSFGEDLPSSDVRAFWAAAAIGMILAQTRFSTVIHNRFVSFDRVLHQVFWLSLVFGVCTYLVTRLLSVGGRHIGWWLVIASIITFICLVVVRRLEVGVLPHIHQWFGKQRRVLFVGDLPTNTEILKWFNRGFTYQYEIQGYFSDTNNDELSTTIPYLGTMTDFALLLDGQAQMDMHIEELFCILPRAKRRLIERIALFCDHNVTHFYYVPVIGDRWEQLSLHPVHLGDLEIFTRYDMPLSNLGNRFIKRTFDILFSFIVLIPIALLTPLFAFLIKRQSPGPVFFAQERTGIGGKTFRCYKFRSMHVNADADVRQATHDDPRKFPFGEFMRRTNLDELPQFFNVLKGDMSIVGPRPHMLYHTDYYGERMKQYMARHFVRPGITGWSQVTGFRGETQTDAQMEGRVKGDIWYMEHWTFWLDIRIIMKTVRSVFVNDENAY